MFLLNIETKNMGLLKKISKYLLNLDKNIDYSGFTEIVKMALVNQFNETFNSGGWRGDKWQDLSKEHRAGYYKDKGGKPDHTRPRTRPNPRAGEKPLHNTGTLLRQLRAIKVEAKGKKGKNIIINFSNVEWYYFGHTRKDGYTVPRKDGTKQGGKSGGNIIPQRRFMGITPTTWNSIKRGLVKYLKDKITFRQIKTDSFTGIGYGSGET